MKKSVNLYFYGGYDEFFTGIYDKNETLTFLEQLYYAKKIGLDCTMIHCQYFEPELDNFWLKNEIGDNICNSYLDQIKKCQNLTKNFVVHLNGSKDCCVSEIGITRLEKLLEECEKYDINLCIENLFSEQEIPYVFSKIKSNHLKICFDTGHKNFLTPNFDVMGNFGKFVSVLHIHDNDGVADLHKIIGKGTIDLENLAKDLAINKDLVLSSEIKYKDENYKEI